MGIRESALNTIASLANGDFVRMVTAAGASRKASLQTIAQHILETYTGTSLAGSNQSVKSAIDGLNSTLSRVTFYRAGVTTAGKTFNVPSSYRGVLWVCDSNSNNVGEYIMYSTGAGAIAMVAVKAPQNITFEMTTNTLAVSVASGSRILAFMNLGGTATISEAT